MSLLNRLNPEKIKNGENTIFAVDNNGSFNDKLITNDILIKNSGEIKKNNSLNFFSSFWFINKYPFFISLMIINNIMELNVNTYDKKRSMNVSIEKLKFSNPL